MKEVPTPRTWKKSLAASQVSALDLLEPGKRPDFPGWCVYEHTFAQCPEIEVICGGINSKMPTAAAIWRQGNLLHFGFQPSPEELNAQGRTMLVNAIVYIARFTEDRPIARTPSIWAGDAQPPRREVLLRAVEAKPRSVLEAFGPRFNAQAPKDDGELAAWIRKHAGYVRPVKGGKPDFDEDLLMLKVAHDAPAFFATAVKALTTSFDTMKRARNVLARYAPGGPGRDAPVETWRAWVKENGPYLFFNDAGGWTWHLDPLAKKRGVPSAKLRGPARASRPAAKRLR